MKCKNILSWNNKYNWADLNNVVLSCWDKKRRILKTSKGVTTKSKWGYVSSTHLPKNCCVLISP